MSWSHRYFPSGNAEMIFLSPLNNFAAKGGCSRVPERCLWAGSQGGVTRGCEARPGLLPKNRAAWSMKEGPDPGGLIWDHPGLKEGATLVLVEGELETSAVLGFLQENSCVYPGLLEEVEYNYFFWAAVFMRTVGIFKLLTAVLMLFLIELNYRIEVSFYLSDNTL